jgi:N-acetylglucosaminyl-diphospho-decaprenol L-rhamnosyltransferase
MSEVDSLEEHKQRESREMLENDPVVVAIVGYRNADDVHACLVALAESTRKSFLISICENGGRQAYKALIDGLDGLVEKRNDPPEIFDERVDEIWVGRLRPSDQLVRIYLAKSNLGYAGGINVCIRQLGHSERWSAIWVLNPDTEPHPNALAALVARAREGPYSIVSSRLVHKSTQRVQSYGGRWRVLDARGVNVGMNAPLDAVPNVKEIERSMDYVSGASLFATRDYIESVGMMDERYFLYCEEVDWCLRRGEHRLGYAHDSIVYHSYGTTIGSHASWDKRSRLSVYLQERNKLLLTRRFYPAIYPLVIMAAFLMTFRYLIEGAKNNFFVALSGWFAGLRGEVGLPKQFHRLETLQEGK